MEETRPELKEKIQKEVYEKFKIDNTQTLEKMNFNLTPGYTIYTMLVKNFHFMHPFEQLQSEAFKQSEQKVKYFGISKNSDVEARENVEILFYHSKEEFAIQLNTVENEEIILYKTKENKTFPEYQKRIEEETKKYEGKRKMQKEEELKIPYMNVDTAVNYEELCGKEIKRKEGGYIVVALQTVKFSLDETGGGVISEGVIQEVRKSEDINQAEERQFDFNDNFILFLKEKDKQKPYLAFKVNSTEIMEIEE